MRVYIASDHAGFALKERILHYFKEEVEDLMLVDLGTHEEKSCDYPRYAHMLAEKVANNPRCHGILICGTGIGMSIAANKFRGIRAALCKSVEEGTLARLHNHANVLCLGARSLSEEENLAILKAWLEAKEGTGRHQERVDLMHDWGEDLF